jgi:hypothetical protein
MVLLTRPVSHSFPYPKDLFFALVFPVLKRDEMGTGLAHPTPPRVCIYIFLFDTYLGYLYAFLL